MEFLFILCVCSFVLCVIVSYEKPKTNFDSGRQSLN